MAAQHLQTYLNDHLAGAEVAVGLLDHLERARAGTPVAGFAADLRAEIVADRRELVAVMARLHVAVSRPRKAAAWFTEKVSELKLRLDDPGGGPLRLLEILEAVSIGIEGKRLLWCALGTAKEQTPALRETDLERLQQRAAEQRDAVEVVRREAARAALGTVG
jgi:hypothetical protein